MKEKHPGRPRSDSSLVAFSEKFIFASAGYFDNIGSSAL